MPTEQEQQAAIEQQLLAMTQAYLKALGRTQSLSKLTVNASLDKTVGVDSLGRVELFHQAEALFGVELPESAMIESQNLADIAKAIVANPHAKHQSTLIQTPAYTQSYDPSDAKSLVEIMITRAERMPDQIHLYLRDGDGEEQIITFGDLYREAKKTAGGLKALGVTRGDTVAIMLPTSEDFFYTLMGIQLVGAIPVPIYPPLRPDKIEEYALRATKILENAEAKVLVTFSQAEQISHLLKSYVVCLKSVSTAVALRKAECWEGNMIIKPEFPGLIQYTSGSTHDPKGVLLGHQQLLENLRSVGDRIAFTPDDVGISWLPLYHDMGLIGTWFNALYQALPLVVMSPLTFLHRPESWLWAIHYHRGTLSAGPNFAFELCVQKIPDEKLKGLDLSTWRLCFNGAEAINPATVKRFIEKFEPYGFNPQAMFPAYGLAETCVALALPPLNQGARVDTIDRGAYESSQRAVPAKADNGLAFVSCGLPIKNHHVRVVDDAGQKLAERQIGNIQFKGPSTMQGYYRQPDATRAIMHGEWVDTGDLGYLVEEQIYVTGRKKDIIIKAGRNLYPIEIESLVAEVAGVRKGCVIAFGVDDPKTGTEKLVVVAETKMQGEKERSIIKQGIDLNIQSALEINPDEIVLIAPTVIPKTSSGKLQRSLCKQMYLDDALAPKRRSLGFQIVKMSVKAVLLKCWQLMVMLSLVIYNMYVLVVWLTSWILLAVMAYVLPAHALNVFLKKLCQILLWMVGCPIDMSQAEPKEKSHVPPIIYVANHASYIDAVIVLAVLPVNSRFVAKKELLKVPVLSTILKKLGAMMIDRSEIGKKLSEVKKISETVKSKHSVVFFPEGTFTAHPGIRPFKMGAFKLAVETMTPVCPVAIRGARHILRDDERLMRPGRIGITIGDLITPKTQGWEEVVRLHHEARDVILAHAGEQSLEL